MGRQYFAVQDMRVCGRGWACGACYFAWHRCEKQINLMVLEMIYKLEGCLGSKIIQCEQLHYQVKFHFSRSSAPYWYNEWAALWHLIDVYWRCCLLDIRISFLWQKGWWILTWHIQAICIVRVQCLLFGFWSLEKINMGCLELCIFMKLPSLLQSILQQLCLQVCCSNFYNCYKICSVLFSSWRSTKPPSFFAWYYSLFILKYCGYSFKHFILVNHFMVFSSPSPDVNES